jgi:hypothetical protein
MAPTSAATATKESQTGEKDAAQNLATVIQSRSTNTPGLKVLIYADGSATAEISDRSFNVRTAPAQPRQYPPGTIDTESLHRLLTEIGDVSKIPTGSCPKSVSFGTRTQISYDGKISGDLQCVRQQTGVDRGLLQASEELAKRVQGIVNQVKTNDRPVWTNK